MVQKFGFTAKASIFVCSATGIYFWPNLCPSLYKNKTAMYREGEKIPVSEDLKNLINDVTTDMKMTAFEKKAIDLYISNGFKPIYGGELPPTMLPTTLVLGIPMIYLAQSKENIPELLEEKLAASVDWQSESGRKLMENCTLSENAQKFAIAQILHEVKSSKFSYQFFTTGAILASTVVTCVSTGFINVIRKKIRLRLSVCTFITAIHLLLIMAINSYFHMEYEKETMLKSSSISNMYAEGGLEYNRKTLEKNKILRKLVQSGEELFNTDGTEINFLAPWLKSIVFEVKEDNLRKR